MSQFSGKWTEPLNPRELLSLFLYFIIINFVLLLFFSNWFTSFPTAILDVYEMFIFLCLTKSKDFLKMYGVSKKKPGIFDVLYNIF